MLELQTAVKRIIASVPRSDIAEIPLENALDLRVAKRIMATVPLPGFDQSSMDGYAVRADDSHLLKPLEVIAEQPAGSSRSLTLASGQAIRIFTGAPMPSGADAVIMQEEVKIIDSSDNFPRKICCLASVARGENVRFVGADVCTGQQLLQSGDLLTPSRIALLASQGQTSIAIFGKPRIAVVTTGDELVDPGNPLKAGQIYNSNRLLLLSMLQRLGLHEVSSHHLPDDLTETKRVLQELALSHDFLILSGGVSVGDHDHVKPALSALGCEPHFWRVKIKPGKPLLYSVMGNCHLFGLPGNPVSSYVTFQLLVRPALLSSMGAKDDELSLPSATAVLEETVNNRGDRPHYIRGQYCPRRQAFYPIGLQQSHALFGLSQSNALLQLEPEQSLPRGSTIHVLLP